MLIVCTHHDAHGNGVTDMWGSLRDVHEAGTHQPLDSEGRLEGAHLVAQCLRPLRGVPGLSSVRSNGAFERQCVHSSSAVATRADEL